MNKSQLIKILENYPDDTQIIVYNPYANVHVEETIGRGSERALRITDDSHLDI